MTRADHLKLEALDSITRLIATLEGVRDDLRCGENVTLHTLDAATLAKAHASLAERAGILRGNQ